MKRFKIMLPDGTETSVLDSRTVYFVIAGHLCPDISRISKRDHIIAANAEGWAELACAGDEYETSALPGLKINKIE